MLTKTGSLIYSIAIVALATCLCHGESPKAQYKSENDYIYTLPTLTVKGQETANIRPATTFESVVSNLDFDPRMDFQSRNMAEAQGDINIRGGIFEGTGIKVGAATLIDPQTGHYTTELPIAPEMLSEGRVYTGAENALRGFNSTAGTIAY
ncbi:MAG: TonB-dependent receptor, partial [Verrucomicrobiota bacterium]|nr:TonB-dependent receptor [Verrucomicrobiota bacterium]